MKKRFTEEQIVRILQKAGSGMATKDMVRKHNISEQTFYRWKSKYVDMQVVNPAAAGTLTRKEQHLFQPWERAYGAVLRHL